MPSNQEHELVQIIEPVKRRLTRFRLLRYLIWGMAAGCALAVIMLLASRWIPFVEAAWYAAGAILAGMIVGVIMGWRRRSTLAQAAKVMDVIATDDAVVTALALLPQTSSSANAGEDIHPFVLLQQKKAVGLAKEFVGSMPKHLPFPKWREWRVPVLATSSLIVAAIVLLALPNPLTEKAIAEAQETKRLEQIAELVEEKVEEIAATELPVDDKSQMTQKLSELRESLVSGELSEDKALEELERMLDEVQQASQEAEQQLERLDQMTEELKQQPLFKDMADHVQQRNKNDLREQFSQMQQQLEQLSEDQKKELNQWLEQLLSDMDENDSAAEALRELAQQLDKAEMNTADLETALDTLEAALVDQMLNENMKDLAQSLINGLNQSADKLATASGKPRSGATDSGTGGNSKGSSGEEDSSGQGEGTPSGSSEGDGNSPTQGSGGDITSGGANGASGGASSPGGTGGTGSGSSPGSGTGSGAGLGRGDRDLVTTPRTMEGDGEQHSDGGTVTGGDVQQGGSSPVLDGAARPYVDVYQEYANSARDSLSRSNLPEKMQERVKAYFEEIQP